MNVLQDLLVKTVQGHAHFICGEKGAKKSVNVLIMHSAYQQMVPVFVPQAIVAVIVANHAQVVGMVIIVSFVVTVSMEQLAIQKLGSAIVLQVGKDLHVIGHVLSTHMGQNAPKNVIAKTLEPVNLSMGLVYAQLDIVARIVVKSVLQVIMALDVNRLVTAY